MAAEQALSGTPLNGGVVFLSQSLPPDTPWRWHQGMFGPHPIANERPYYRVVDAVLKAPPESPERTYVRIMELLAPST